MQIPSGLPPLEQGPLIAAWVLVAARRRVRMWEDFILILCEGINTADAMNEDGCSW